MTDRLAAMKHPKELYFLLIGTILVRLPWMFMVPMHEAPDENTHVYIVTYLADKLCLPTREDLLSGGQLSVYAPLPPFGYIPHILSFWTLQSILDPSMAPRMGSLVLAPVTTYCAWWLGRELFPDSRLCALAVPLLVVFHPQLVLVHCYTNNDVTSSALSALLLCLATVLIKSGLNLRLSILIGALCGWLALTKYSGYAVLPAVATAFLSAWFIHKNSIKQLVSCTMTALCLAAAIAIPWFWRNYQMYDGDATGTTAMRTRWAALYDKPLAYFVSPLKIAFDHRWWRMMFFSYWGMFGYMTRPLPKPLYWTYLGFLIAAGLGGIKALSRFNHTKFALLKDHFCDRKSLTIHAIWLTQAVCLLTNLSLMIWASTGNVGGPQGRYLFTSEIPFLAVMVLGLSKLGPTWSPRLIKALLLFNLLVYIWSFAMLYPVYGFRWKIG